MEVEVRLAGPSLRDKSPAYGRWRLDIVRNFHSRPLHTIRCKYHVPDPFIIYVSGVHEAGEGDGLVRSLSFVSDITWVAHGRSVREVRAKLEGGARRAVAWGRNGGVLFELAKTEAILFSRNRKHWKERAHERIRIESHQVPFNVKATRWPGIYLDSRLGFGEHETRSFQRARVAERRLSSIVTRHGVPPIAARHLQEAIVGSTLMYGSEITWRCQKRMSETFQKSINRMSRSSLCVLRQRWPFYRRKEDRFQPRRSWTEDRTPSPSGWPRPLGALIPI